MIAKHRSRIYLNENRYPVKMMRGKKRLVGCGRHVHQHRTHGSAVESRNNGEPLRPVLITEMAGRRIDQHQGFAWLFPIEHFQRPTLLVKPAQVGYLAPGGGFHRGRQSCGFHGCHSIISSVGVGTKYRHVLRDRYESGLIPCSESDWTMRAGRTFAPGVPTYGTCTRTTSPRFMDLWGRSRRLPCPAHPSRCLPKTERASSAALGGQSPGGP